MKLVLKKSALLFVAIVMLFATLGLTACNKEASNIYTVKVIDPDGNPYAGVYVQVCKSGDANGFCVAALTNEQGVATFEIGKEITDTSVNLMDVHLLGLPPYFSYAEPVTMSRGQTITIQVSYRVPKRGTGKGGYTTDESLGETTERFDMSIFDPYVVEEAAYRVKFSDAEQKIYFAFAPTDAAVYKVYSVGEVDASITELFGDRDSGIRNPHDAAYQSDNISDTDKNFSYKFAVGESVFQQLDKHVYFEMALEDASHVNTDFYIYFEYEGEYDAGSAVEPIDVLPKAALTPYGEQDGEYSYVEFTATCTLSPEDGYYHVDVPGNPVLVATLGTYASLNASHTEEVIPRGMAVGFMTRSETVGLTIQKSDAYYNYLPLVTEYVKNSNSESRYPVTAELKTFLEDYILRASGNPKGWAQQEIGTFLPDDVAWLFVCGYYA